MIFSTRYLLRQHLRFGYPKDRKKHPFLVFYLFFARVYRSTQTIKHASVTSASVIRLYSKGSKNFQTVANSLKPGKKYYYRVFATNVQGTALVSVESLTTAAGPSSPIQVNIQPGRQPPPTGGRAAGSGIFTSMPTAGLATRSWGGSSRWKARRRVCGYGSETWAGFGRKRKSIRFYMPPRPSGWFISTGSIRTRPCFTIMCVKNGQL